jgi:hypothetical protein
MQASLTFDLSTEDGRAEHADALAGSTYKSILWEFDNHLRSLIKYEAKLGKKERDIYSNIRKKLWEILNENNLDIV